MADITTLCPTCGGTTDSNGRRGYTVREAAERLGCKPKTVSNMLSALRGQLEAPQYQRLPGHGRLVRFLSVADLLTLQRAAVK